MACPIDNPTHGRDDRRGRQSRARWTQAEIIILEAEESRYLTRSGLRGGLRWIGAGVSVHERCTWYRYR